MFGYPLEVNYFDVTFGNIAIEEIATSFWLSSGGWVGGIFQGFLVRCTLSNIQLTLRLHIHELLPFEVHYIEILCLYST